MEGFETSGQDGAQFEDALRRLNALEHKLATQVLEDISELRKLWVQGRVDRVTNNTYKLYEVRKHLKTSKLLYVEEEQLLSEFDRVKATLLANSMDDDTFDACKQTCLVLGGKLGEVRTRQLLCYSASRDLETDINNNIMKLSFQPTDLAKLDLGQVRSNTPCRELSPTPLDRHRSKSRDPSPFRMPALKLSSGTSSPTPAGGAETPDPHAYFSTPASSQSIYGGRGPGGRQQDLDSFRAAMEAKQMEDDSPPQRRHQPPATSSHAAAPSQLSKSASGNIVLRSASGVLMCRSDGTEAGTSGEAFDTRPGSAMSDASINIPDLAPPSRPSSRQDFLGDVVSSGSFDNFSEVPSNEVSMDTHIKLIEEDKLKQEEKKKIEKLKEEENRQLEQRKQEENKKLREKEEEKRKAEALKLEEEKKIKQEQIRVKELEEKKKLEKLKEEEEQKKLKEQEELKKRKEQEEKQKMKEEADRKKLKDQEEKKRLKEEEDTRKLKEKEEKKQEKIKEQERKKEAEKKRLEEEKMKKQREEEAQKKVLEEEKQRKIKEAEKKKEEEKQKQMLEEENNKRNVELTKKEKMKKQIKSQGEEVAVEDSTNIIERRNSVKKSSSFSKKKTSFDEEDVEPISQAKQLFAAIADTTLEAGKRKLRKDKAPEAFPPSEPAIWHPEDNLENEDELMIILNDSPEKEPIYASILPKESRQSKTSADIPNEPIYASIEPNANGHEENLTDDGYFINKEEELPYYEPEEDIGSEYSRVSKKVSFAQSEERFEFDVPKKETAFRSFTNFLAKELPLNFRRDPSLEEKLATIEASGDDKENLPPVAPRRSKSKTRSASLQASPRQPVANIAVQDPRSQSLTRAGEGKTPKAFLSAMTGGLYDSSQGLKLSRSVSRQSSGDRSSLVSWSGWDEDPSQSQSQGQEPPATDVLSQLKRMKLRSSTKQVEQADFDELFARGMALSKTKEENDEGTKKSLILNEDMKKDNGIGYAEKVMSYLDDQSMTNNDGGHVSRGRRKHRTKTDPSPATEPDSASKPDPVVERKRSREYTKPEDIKLSPVVKRDLFTGEILPESQWLLAAKSEASTKLTPTFTLAPAPAAPSKEQAQYSHHNGNGLDVSPGKSFLEATTGHEVFGRSIEEDHPIMSSPKHPEQRTEEQKQNTSVADQYSGVIKDNYHHHAPAPAPRREEPGAGVQPGAAPGVNLPMRLKPDKLMANEEFYEQLRESMRQVEGEEEAGDTEAFSRYSHHLGRAEFGSLKKKSSRIASEAASRDPSGDRSKAFRSIGASQDRLSLAGKAQASSRCESRLSAASTNYLPDLEVDDNIELGPRHAEPAQLLVHRTASLLVTDLEAGSPGMAQVAAEMDVLAKREGVLRDIEDKKNQIREAKAWLQNGLMTVLGFGVMVYLQNAEAMG